MVASWQGILSRGAVQSPNFYRVEVEVRFGCGAEGGFIFIVRNVALTVAPKSDRIEIFQVGGILKLRYDFQNTNVIEMFCDIACCRGIRAKVLKVELWTDMRNTILLFRE